MISAPRIVEMMNKIVHLGRSPKGLLLYCCYQNPLELRPQYPAIKYRINCSLQNSVDRRLPLAGLRNFVL